MNDSNDFESRARAAGRAAGRAARRAVDDVPTVTALAHRRSRGPIRALAIAAAVVLVAVAGTAIAVNERADGPGSDVTSFCTNIAASFSQPVNTVTNDTTGGTSTDRDPHADDYLRNAPSEIRDAALTILSDRQHNRPVDRANSQRLLNWFEVRCYPNAALPGADAENQRFAPLPAPPGVSICSVTNRFPLGDTGTRTSDTYGTIAIFGDSTLSDPYWAPMIGLAASKEEVFRDDETATPVAIPGHPDAVISAMSSAFSNRLTGSQVISWRDGDRNIGVLGRGYGAERSAQLIAIASRVTITNFEPQVAADALPTHFQQLHRGPLIGVSVLTAASSPASSFSLYGSEARLQMNGTVITSESDGTFEAIRFFSPAVARVTVGRTAALLGPVVGSRSGSPSIEVARWRMPGGVVLTALSLPGATSVGAPDLHSVIRATRRLDRDEWENLVNGSTGCGLFGGEGRTSAATARSQESSGSGVATTSPSPSSTSTTAPGSRP